MQPDRQQIQTYNCGPETNFMWTPYNTFPSCFGKYKDFYSISFVEKNQIFK